MEKLLITYIQVFCILSFFGIHIKNWIIDRKDRILFNKKMDIKFNLHDINKKMEALKLELLAPQYAKKTNMMNLYKEYGIRNI